jgi:hypothetical protein
MNGSRGLGGTPLLRRILWSIIILALIPGLLLAARRVSSEGTQRNVTLLLDGQALQEQADALGLDAFSLALRYQQDGLNGVALYEQTPESLALQGRITGLLGHEAAAAAAVTGTPLPPLPTNGTLLSELQPGSLDQLLAKNRPEPLVLQWAERAWYSWPGDSFKTRPAGPDLAEFQRYADAGFDLAYRPRNFPNLQHVGSDFPELARYLIHTGLELQGQPDGLSDLVAASQGYITGIIEGTDQEGMDEVVDLIPTTRLLSFSQEHLNRRLQPEEVAGKYVLAAEERGIRIMYLRPYTEEQLGNMLENTSLMISTLRAQLEAEGYTIAPLDFLETSYRTDTLLRSLSALGILAALGLLALLYPGAWGPVIALAVLGVGLAAGGLHWAALALMAALVFPVLGYAYLRERLASLGVATLISLAGAVLLAAVGSDHDTMLAITPFRGVGATLVLPPLLFALHYALRFKSPVQWVRDLAAQPLTVGLVAVVLVGVGAVGLVVLRRGNFPIIGASEAELALRNWLNELFVRPRFKELIGHPLAVVGLLGPQLPAWLRGGLLTAGVVAQASILNSFSHYHTPLLISLQRTVIALVLGLLAGLLLSLLLNAAIRLGRRWLASAEPAVEIPAETPA